MHVWVGVPHCSNVHSNWMIREPRCSPTQVCLAADLAQTALIPSNSSFCWRMASRPVVAFFLNARRLAQKWWNCGGRLTSINLVTALDPSVSSGTSSTTSMPLGTSSTCCCGRPSPRNWVIALGNWSTIGISSIDGPSSVCSLPQLRCLLELSKRPPTMVTLAPHRVCWCAPHHPACPPDQPPPQAPDI